MNVLIVVDVQNDFVSMALGTEEARKIINPLKEYLDNLQPGKICRKTKTENELFESRLQKAAICISQDTI